MNIPVDNLTDMLYNIYMSTTSKPKDARKIRYTPIQIKELILLLDRYIEQTDFPMLTGFITIPEVQHKYKISTQYIYEHPEIFERSLSVMSAKCESYLVKKGLNSQAMPMVIFMLKQLKYGGYSDNQQIDLKSNGQPIKFVNNVPRPPKVKST